MVQDQPPIVHKPQHHAISKIVPSLLGGTGPPSCAPPPRPPRVRRGAAGTTALVLLSVVAVGACTDSTKAVTPSAAPSLAAPPSAAASPSASPETLALNAYSGMWKAYAKAGLTANPDEPDLAAHAADPALKMLRDALAGYRDKKQVFKGEYGSRPTVVETSPKDQPVAVVIADCLDSRNFLVYKANGELADDVPGGRRSTGATVKLQGGAWKVTSFAIREKGTC